MCLPSRKHIRQMRMKHGCQKTLTTADAGLLRVSGRSHHKRFICRAHCCIDKALKEIFQSLLKEELCTEGFWGKPKDTHSVV